MVVPRRWCSFLISVRMSTRSLASRLDSGSSNRKSLRIAHQRPAHGDALALAAGELAGLAVEQVLDLQQLRRPAATRSSLLALRHAAHLQAEGDVLRHRHGRIERVGLEHHGDVAVLRRHVVDDRRPPIAISPPVTVSRPAIMLSSVDLPQPDGPTSTRNSPSLERDVDALEDLDRAEALLDA